MTETSTATTIQTEASTLEQDFQTAVEGIRNGDANDSSKKITDSLKLQFYGLYKQATEGDCNTSRPWAVQLVARAKWDAWNSLKGIEQEDAKRQYIVLYKQHA